MRYVRFIWVIAGVFLITNLFAATTEPVVTIKADKTQTVIGGLITLAIEVKGATIKNISWGVCDTALAGIQNVIILKGLTSFNSNSFKHTIIFTSTKPGNITIDHLPVMVNDATGGYKLFTAKVTVNFKNEALLTNINDINSNVATRFSELKYVLFAALVIIIIIIVLAARYSVDKKKKAGSVAPLQIQQAALEKLELLEQQPANDKTVDTAFDVLKDFLQQAFTSINFTATESELLQSINSFPVKQSDKELIIGILKVSANIRFTKPQDSGSTAAYIAKVKGFISGISIPTVKI